MRILKHLAIAAAMVGLVAPAQAEYYPGSTDFEGVSPLTDACWSNVVEAAIEVDASVADVPRSPNLPPSFDMTCVAGSSMYCVKGESEKTLHRSERGH